MRLGLSERTAIEAGIYNRASFVEIAKQIGVSKKTVSNEIINADCDRHTLQWRGAVHFDNV